MSIHRCHVYSKVALRLELSYNVRAMMYNAVMNETDFFPHTPPTCLAAKWRDTAHFDMTIARAERCATYYCTNSVHRTERWMQRIEPHITMNKFYEPPNSCFIGLSIIFLFPPSHFSFISRVTSENLIHRFASRLPLALALLQCCNVWTSGAYLMYDRIRFCYGLCNMQLNVARDNCMACVDDSVTTAEQIDVERQ